MGIQLGKKASASYPYVGEHGPTKVLFIGQNRGYDLSTGTFSRDWRELKFQPIVHTVTFDLS